MDYRNTLETLQALHAAAGDELPLAKALQTLAAPYCDTCEIDTLGNVLAHRAGDGPKRLLAAQMDVPGLVVTHVETSGELRVGKLGDLSLKAALNRPFRFKSGVVGTLRLEEKAEQSREPAAHALFLDIGARDRAAAEALVQVGDTAMAALPALTAEGRVVVPHASLLSCLVLLDSMERSAGSKSDLTFVFSAQGSLGLRGLKTAAFAAMPDSALAIAPAPAEQLEEKGHRTVKLSAGAAIKVMDGDAISHPELAEQLAALAAEGGIPFQREVHGEGRSAGAILQLSGPGVRVAGVGIPCRYHATLAEMVDLEDLSACARLLAAFCEAEQV